jgi:hypothetical protein
MRSAFRAGRSPYYFGDIGRSGACHGGRGFKQISFQHCRP